MSLDASSSASSITIELYAIILAHIRFFGVPSTDEILRRFEIEPLRWATDSAAWSAAMLNEVAAEEESMPLSLGFSRPYQDTLKRLRLEKPSIDTIGTGPVESEPPTIAAPAAKPPTLEELPEREPEKPSYLLADGETAAKVNISVSEAPTILEAATLPVTGDEPSAPSTPFTTAEPDESGFSLPQYARLCAELVRSTDRSLVLGHYGLDKTKHAELDAHWRGRMRTDRSIATAFERAYNDQLVELDRQARAEPKEGAPRGTLPLGFQLPLPPKEAGSPPAASVPKLSLEQHALLCAEIAMGLDLPAAILARWSVSPAEKEAEDAHYRQLVRTDRAVNETWQAAFEAARKQILSRSGRAR